MRRGVLLAAAVLFLLSAGAVFGAPPSTDDDRTPVAVQPKQIDDDVYVNANRILMFVTNHGNFGRDLADVFGHDAGTFFPYTTIDDIYSGKNDNYVLYCAGLWIGGNVNGQIRVALAEYNDEYVPGPMEGGTFQPDLPEFRVYKLYHDSLADNPNGDYLNWPVDQGAPVNSDGTPKMVGDQMLWTVFNDADPGVHDNNAGETQPLGVEVQQTVWASEGAGAGDTVVISEPVATEHVGPGSGTVYVAVSNPSALTGHAYMVVFHEQPYPEVDWDLIDRTTGQIVLSHQQELTGTAHGLTITVEIQPVNGVDSILEVADGSGPLDPPEDVMNSPNSSGDWFVDSDQPGDFSRMNWRGLMGNSSWEFRFTEGGSNYYDWSTDELVGNRAPFEVWNIGVKTPDDPADDARLNFAYIDDDFDGGWSWEDRLYVIETPYVEPAPATAVYDYPDDFQIGRIKFRDYSGAMDAPAVGTIVRFVTYDKPLLSSADTFSFVAPSYWTVPGGGESNAIYLKYKLYNRGGNAIQDCYVALWADPDLGGAGDDLVGCDTLSNQFFCYNATNADAEYMSRPPAIGFKSLAGPLVPSLGDTASFDNRRMPGFRNLPMTAFAKYINGTDPNNSTQTYYYMQGFRADGTPWPNGTKYAVPGDPVLGTGDLDVYPADRRMMASFGPFNFAPGDSQFVLIKMAVGQGDNRLHSIEKMRQILDASMPVDPDEAVLRVEGNPDTISVVVLRALNPPVAAVKMGYDAMSPLGPEFALNSIAMAGLPAADSMRVLASANGFNGPVVCYYFNPTSIVESYGVLWGAVEHAFTATGSYATGGTFSVPGSLVIQGHRRGDFDVDGSVTVSDLTALVSFLFRGGPAPQQVEAVDMNGSGNINVSDMAALIMVLFRS